MFYLQIFSIMIHPVWKQHSLSKHLQKQQGSRGNHWSILNFISLEKIQNSKIVTGESAKLVLPKKKKKKKIEIVQLVVC